MSEGGLISRWHTMRLDNPGVLAPLLLSLCFAPVAIGADSSVISHCATNEDVFFSCPIKTKIVSVCAVRNRGVIERLSYRYGALGKIENQYTVSEHNQNRFFGNVERRFGWQALRQIYACIRQVRATTDGHRTSEGKK